MRILQVDKFLRRSGGGGTCYMLDLTDVQRAAGHEVEFFSMADDRNIAATYADHFPPNTSLSPPPEGAAAKAGAVVTMIHSRAAARGIEAVIDDFKPDVAHLHNIYHQLSPSILRSLAKRSVPIVMTVHDYKLVCPSYQLAAQGEICEDCLPKGGGRFWNAPRRRCKDGSLAMSSLLALESSIHRLTKAYDPVGLFLSPSDFLAGKLRQAGPFPDRVRHVPNFVDVDAYEPSDDVGDYFLYLGRLSWEKGIDVLIDAAGKTGARVLIAGDGPDRIALEAQAAAAAPGQVEFLGHVDKSRVIELARGARASVLPSVWYENMPMSILETMAAGTPMITTDLGGLPEMIEHGRTGYLVPPRDSDALAAVMTELTRDREAAAAMGRAARRSVSERYNAAVHLDLIDAAYADVL